jgi:hypothetical protein
MKELIAECSIIFCPPDGKEILTSVQVGRPRQEDDLKWACDVEIPGVDRPRTIHGTDSLHALILAVGYLSDRLEHLVSNGALLLSPNNREPAAINDILPRI